MLTFGARLASQHLAEGGPGRANKRNSEDFPVLILDTAPVLGCGVFQRAHDVGGNVAKG